MPDRARAIAARARAPWAVVTLGPLRVPDGLLVLRSPTLADGPAWSAARLANRDWLERAFPAWGQDWEAEQSEVAWAQRCWRLRILSARGRAEPFVMMLDGRLIGEIGIDAVDEVTGTGEASVWMVRSHGSAAVMNGASLLLITHCFSGRRTLDRITSPVATSSRKGRGPGLSAVGFEIEATVPRRVGERLVDHDIWVVPNNARTRQAVATALRHLDSQASSTSRHAPDERPVRPAGARTAVALTAARAAARETRAAARRARELVARRRVDSSAGRTVPVAGSDELVVLRPATRGDLARLKGTDALPSGSTRRAVEADRRVVAVIAHQDDVGTATTEIFVTTHPGAPRDVLVAALSAVLDELRPGPDEARALLLRTPARPADGTAPDAAMLTAVGMNRIATYCANPEGLRSWGGEEVWQAPARS